MPPGVQHPGNEYHALADGDTVDLWLPFPYDGNPNSRGSHFMEGIARLKAGVSPEQAGADMTTVLAQLASEHPADKGWRVFLVPLYREMVGQHAAHAAGAAVGGGAAAVDRVRERGEPAAARGRARGCGRLRCGRRWARRAGRIVRQLVTESLAIALAAGALGTVFAVGGVRRAGGVPAGGISASGGDSAGRGGVCGARWWWRW